MHQIGLIGTGYWGPNIVRSLEATGRAKIIWLCDLDTERVQGLGSRYPDATTTTDFNDLLNDPHLRAVAISTPTVTHFDLARAALLAGKDVLVEKPITFDSEEARQLTRIAREKKRVLMVGHVFQYNATIRYLKELIHSGELGDIHYLNLKRTNLGPVRTDVNALWDLASHDVSIIIDLLGRVPKEVTARGQAYLNPDIEDVVFANYTFEDGTMAHIHASWLNPRKIRQITVVGSRKMVLWDDMDIHSPLRIFDKRVDQPPVGQIEGTFLEHKTWVVDGGVFIPNVRTNQPLLAECNHFLDCLDSGKTPESDGENGLQVVEALEAAASSMQNNSALTPVQTIAP
ncbi:MAG: Gfo/Idh/MocA family oxidoreductase [Magnetococcales bacterium]|nr:Gfo/Idh/MocA family oxidoreductase [Magnetococcales bacterium]